jgi:hypothetical protein
MNYTQPSVPIEPIVGTVRTLARERGLNGWSDLRPFGATMQSLEELMLARDIALGFRLRQHRELTDHEASLADRVAETIGAASRDQVRNLARRAPR